MIMRTIAAKVAVIRKVFNEKKLVAYLSDLSLAHICSTVVISVIFIDSYKHICSS